MVSDSVIPDRSFADMGNFRKLRVWEEARALAVEANRVAKRISGVNNAELRDQLTRAAISVHSNIVEGATHQSPREFARFLSYALASASEVEGHIQLARDLELVSDATFKSVVEKVENVRKMLHGLKKRLNSS